MIEPGVTTRPAAQQDDRAAALREHVSARDVPCPQCGYNLRGAADNRCPECGSLLRVIVVTTRSPVRTPSAGALRWAEWAMSPLALVVLAVIGLWLAFGRQVAAVPVIVFTAVWGILAVRRGLRDYIDDPALPTAQRRRRHGLAAVVTLLVGLAISFVVIAILAEISWR
ncbi:MAG: hypothetical protein WD749_09310 [Phycisphaerales bacterium]